MVTDFYAYKVYFTKDPSEVRHSVPQIYVAKNILSIVSDFDGEPEGVFIRRIGPAFFGRDLVISESE